MGECLDRDFEVQDTCIVLIRHGWHTVKFKNLIMNCLVLFGSISGKNTCCFVCSIYVVLWLSWV
jgi:hypothetical protein